MRSGASLATAESCSGGLIAHRVTGVPGISACFRGGVVAYANAAKAAVLGVDADVIASEGAVSGAVAAQMATGVRERFDADYGVGVTGVAGPGGGTLDKPVGLVYIAVSGAVGPRVERCQFSGTRSQVKEQTARRALEMLLELLA